MGTVNYVVIRRNGMTITGQAGSVDEALAELERMAADPFYNPNTSDRIMQRWERVFVAPEGGGLIEYTTQLGIKGVGLA